jgi:hypothetical protein
MKGTIGMKYVKINVTGIRSDVEEDGSVKGRKGWDSVSIAHTR